ncbi:MAG: phosphoadenosine phosphosulfate reductase domain-containing protein [Rhizobiaceae bacterium]
MNPYLITGPALISFSGGRTSAFMLHEILRAHDGKLPDDVVVAFANTGKEREETLRFVHECGSRWGVKISWLEWRPPATFEEVGFNSADRSGVWFAELIRRKQYLPNSQMRYCTTKLKVETMKKFMLSLGYERWVNPVGLRYDEGTRVLRQLARNDSGKERFTALMPLSKAKVTKRDVMRFWLGDNADPRDLTHPLPQGFDLGLRDYEGNCDLCFLKGRGKRATIIRERPDLADWWAEQERSAKTKMPDTARFDAAESVEQLAAFVRNQGTFSFLDDDPEEYDVECGLYCAPEGHAA